MSQTAYTQDPAVAIEGMLADLGVNELRTAIANETISFGLGVTREAGGAADDRPPRGGLPNAAGDVTGGVFLGISRADTTIEQAATPVGYIVDQEFGYLRKGHIWVNSETVAVLGAALFIRHAAGAFPTLGASRNDADTASAARVPGASFRSASAAVNNLALVELKGHVT